MSSSPPSRSRVAVALLVAATGGLASCTRVGPPPAAPGATTGAATSPGRTAFPCATAAVTDAYHAATDRATWPVYDRPDLRFRIHYPPGWVLDDGGSGASGRTTVMFRPPDMASDWAWNLTVGPLDPEGIERGIAGMGSQFGADRVETRAPVTVDGVEGTRVTVVTCRLEGWYDERIVLEQGDRVLTIDNGAVRDRAFEGFVQSLEFTR